MTIGITLAIIIGATILHLRCNALERKWDRERRERWEAFERVHGGKS